MRTTEARAQGGKSLGFGYGTLVSAQSGSVISEALRPELSAPALARRSVAAVLDAWDLAHLNDQAALLTSELVTNAVVHAGTPIALVIQRSDRGLRVEVHDDNPALPNTGVDRKRQGAGRLGKRRTTLRRARATEQESHCRRGTVAGGRPVHVVPRGGEWVVEREGAAPASSRHRTQAEADGRGRAVARREHVELIVHGRDGRIRERDSYGNDPRRTQG